MKTISQVGRVKTEQKVDSGFAVDTTFVLFFLAVELGQSFDGLSVDFGILAATLGMILVLPYFLYSNTEKPKFGNWLLGRSMVLTLAVLIGVLFKQSLGVILPDTFRFLPMTLLIVTAMVSCYIQFYGLLKLRLAK